MAQQGINYKALIKDASNAVVANQSITVQFTILQGVVQTNVYQETHTPTTDANGIIIVNIGQGTTTDDFSGINWGADDHYLNTQIDIGSGLTDMGTTQFMAVPYALSAGNVTGLEVLDAGYDAGIWGNTASSFAIYSELVEANTGLNMAIQSLPYENLETMEVPLGIHSNVGEQITVSISESDLPTSVDVYLEDRDNNTFTLLTTTDFVITPSQNLDTTGRFYLRFSAESLSTTETEFDGLKIFTTKTPRVLTVSGRLIENTELKLYDVRGRLVLTDQLNETVLNNKIDVSGLEDGVYVVELYNGVQRKSQKVIIR